MPDTTDYTSIGNIKEYMLTKIAPNYFDMDNQNNYNIGIFGYINEIIATAIEDGQNAANVIRREFYPATAQFTSSLYKMAAVQDMDVPMTTPAVAKAALIISQDEIIANSTYSNGVYTCVIDNVLKIMADDLTFMLDYPIIIISKKTNSGKWTHTIHYDITYSNSLNSKNSARYISNNIIKNEGTNYLVLFIDTIRQVDMQSVSNLVIKDSSLASSTMDINFDGNLANFEVFYYETPNSTPVQLKKVLINAKIPDGPFCYYEIINETKLRLTFPKNNTFNPAFNSEIVTQIYTSMGPDGNFDSYKDSLVCSSNSTRYPYNSKMIITGLINGSSVGGRAKLSQDEFKNSIIAQYSTNNTITTSNDLQLYFDSISEDLSNLRVLFRKKRDDALIRLFGAYILLKDSNDDVAPTNTLDATISRSSVMELSSNANRVMIKPGTLFEYVDPESASDYTIRPVVGSTILDELDPKKFYFTNPFLIGANINPNILGYYLNSIDKTYSIEYSYVNDETENQFILKNIQLKRNAIMGSNYYTIIAQMMPASTDLDGTTIIAPTDRTAAANMIRAKADGKVISSEYVYSDDCGKIITTVRYNDNTTEEILSSNYCILNADGESFDYFVGNEMQFDVGSTFLEGDILAFKKDTDLGKLRLSVDLGGYLYVNNLYLPLIGESYDPATNSFTFVGYVATDDMVDLNSQIVLTHGLIRDLGHEDDNIAVPMNGLSAELNAFYRNDDTNKTHKYSEFLYMKGYTLTNTYVTSPDATLDFIKEISFIRSVLDYTEGDSAENYNLSLDEVPVLQANWVKEAGNYTYFVNKIFAIYDKMQLAYRALENNFSIDMKFYNTYGRSKFYQVGISSDIVRLNNVNCNFRFGVYLTTSANIENFASKFRAYIKTYIESIANATTAGQNIYILNMIADVQKEFPEIGYMEYYGFNIYDHMAQKIIAPDFNEYQDKYIPEFINIKNAVAPNGTIYPDIEVVILTQ